MALGRLGRDGGHLSWGGQGGSRGRPLVQARGRRAVVVLMQLGQVL